MNEVQPYYRFRAEAGDEPESAELLIYDVIGNWDDMGEVGARQFAVALSKLPTSVKRLDIHINSPGGAVQEAYGIYSRLADHRSEKIVYIDGWAASAASIVAMVGHKIYIRANANVMIHLPMALAIGNADDMRTVIAALDSVTESMINVYARRTKLDRDKLRSMMAAETWMHPDEAVANGFADEVRGVVKAAAMIGDKRAMVNGMTFDLSRFHNVPAFTGEQPNLNMTTEPTAPTTPNPTPPTPGPGPTTPPQPGTNPPPPPQPGTNPPRPVDPPPPPPTPSPPPSDAQAAVQAERDRVAALMKLDKPATHAIIMKAIADGKQPHEITSELLDAMERASQQQDRRMDAAGISHIPPSDGGNQPNSDAFTTALRGQIEARRKSRPKPVVSGYN